MQELMPVQRAFIEWLMVTLTNKSGNQNSRETPVHK